MQTIASAASIESEAVEYVTWPEPGEPGAWGEMTFVGISSRAFSVADTPYSVRRAPASAASDLGEDLEAWLAAGAEALVGIDAYIDALEDLA